MRLLLIALVLALTATVATSFHAGRRVEAEYRAAVLALGGDDEARVVIDRYERGLFFSQATTLVTPREADPDAASHARVALHHRIEHGPYPVSYLTSGLFDGSPVAAQVATEVVLELEGEEEIEEVPLPVLVDALFRWTEGVTLRISPDREAEALDDPELTADWDAIHGEVQLAYDGAVHTGELEVPQLAFDGEAARFELEGLHVEYEYERVGSPESGSARPPVMVGYSRFSLDRLVLEDGDDGIAIHGLEFENASDVSQGTWSMQVNAAVDAVEDPIRAAAGLAAGSAPTPTGGEFALRLGGIALAPMAELASAGSHMEGEGLGSEAMKLELAGAAGALWPRLMAPGPELEISRLRLATPEGEIRLAFRAGVDATEPAMLANPFLTLPALEVDLELSLPAPILESWLAVPRPVPTPGADLAPWVKPAEFASKRVGTWLERGHLDRHDGSYVTSVRVRRGTVRLNGRVVSFDSL